MAPLVRIVEGALGPEGQVRLVVSGVSDLDGLTRAWASSGATIERRGERVHASTTVVALTRAAGRALGSEEARRLLVSAEDAARSWSRPAPALRAGSGRLAFASGPALMGVVNVTPDSFSDGGSVYPGGHPEAAIALGRELVQQGADVLDIGGESSRPGASPVEESEELARVAPVLDGLADAGVLLSIDTTKAAVARVALAAGAGIVNDVSGAAHPELLETVADSDAAYVLMHTRGTPADMSSRAQYDDVVAEVYEFLAEGLERVQRAGIEAARVVVDPGLGFAKEGAHNAALLRCLRQLRGLGRPVLVGASRKRFLGALLEGAPATGRLEGSLACAVAATLHGAAIIRAHDVAPTRRAVHVAHAIAAA